MRYQDRQMKQYGYQNPAMAGRPVAKDGEYKRKI